ncbi:MAG: glycoside hydrolase family 13 protein [Clostridiales bacterium]|nr:glycoside hydrolase family 13 protein [Clostridiales bacterium]
MRILYDSKLPQYKTPFGTLTPGQVCTVHIHIPCAVGTTAVTLLLKYEDGKTGAQDIPLEKQSVKGAYEVWGGDFSIPHTGLYFYYFHVHKPDGGFRLFKQGDDTNMEDGSLWQVSCVPADFHTPDWAKGATIYQIFPDRFYKAGNCDPTGKLTPYTLHRTWGEEVEWKPTADGKVLNNDFYGGNFKGITEKLDYIASLGVNLIYLNPISKSFSSHRYDTGDYKTPDPLLGTEEDFAELCRQAHSRGIRVILDGVYSHTGSNSPYFNREGQFDSVGAYNSTESPYYSWYTFYNWPDSYNSWWNFDTLPTVNKMDPAFINYIIEDEDSVVAHWLKLGADGFRLDVADELPDEFIGMLRRRIKGIKPDALLLGEVWEDASTKIAYGRRRSYFTAGELDSVMNYPFRTAIIDYVRGRDGGQGLKEAVMAIVENYPPEVVQCNMNLLGTHDTPRILTVLVDDFNGTREEMSKRRLSRHQFDIAYDRLLMASFLQYTLPGSPSLYYGDEAGMEGGKDPFNRRTYPWGYENMEFVEHFKRLGRLRREHPAFRYGDIQFFQAGDRHVGFTRSYEGRTYRVYCNRDADPWQIPANKLVAGYSLQIVAPDWLTLGPRGYCITEDE